MGIAHHHDRRALFQIRQFPQLQCRQILFLDLDDRQVHVSIRCMDPGDSQPTPIAQLHTKWPGVPNHVQVGGNQAGRIDNKSCPHTQVSTVPARKRNHRQ